MLWRSISAFSFVARYRKSARDRAGLSHATIMRAEKRERMPTIDTLLRISDALEIDLSVFLRRAVSEIRPRSGRPEPRDDYARGKAGTHADNRHASEDFRCFGDRSQRFPSSRGIGNPPEIGPA